MSRLFYHVMQDNAGNLLFDVSGTMRIAGSGTLATIYGDEALTVILPNPMTNHPSYGSFKCFLGAGDYDFYMAKSGYTFETLTGVQGHGTMAQQDADAVAITGGTIAGVTLPLGTMAVQHAGAVAITGGSATGLTQVLTNVLRVPNRTGDNVQATSLEVETAGGTGRLNLYVPGSAPNFLAGRLQLGTQTPLGAEIGLYYTAQHGISFLPAVDTGAFWACQFLNSVATPVGSISTTGSATAFNTSSDARLKKEVETLTGELALMQALRPVRFTWRADDSPGVGFLAQEVAALVDGVVTGEPDAVEEDGRIRPMQIDHSKLVPFLVGALKELAASVQALQARVSVLEKSLGL